MGEVFAGRYELVDPIGRGGVGAVWRTWDHRRRRYVAAKVLQQRDAHALLRFVREQAVRIDHPHVLAPASWAADDDKVLFTMDLVAGGSLVNLVNDYGPLPPAYVCLLLDQLLSGLAAVHAEGVIHRDIKPANVLLEATGTARPRLRLSDFGIAMRLGEPRLTETNYVVGTPGYFAPEQMLGADPDFPADLFAVGLVALYLLEGAKPDSKALIEHFAAHGTPKAPRGIPEPLWQVIATLLQPDPHARFRTATGARKALAAATELLPEPGPDDELVEVFDQLGPLPVGFGSEGPLQRASGLDVSGTSTGATSSSRSGRGADSSRASGDARGADSPPPGAEGSLPSPGLLPPSAHAPRSGADTPSNSPGWSASSPSGVDVTPPPPSTPPPSTPPLPAQLPEATPSQGSLAQPGAAAVPPPPPNGSAPPQPPYTGAVLPPPMPPSAPPGTNSGTGTSTGLGPGPGTGTGTGTGTGQWYQGAGSPSTEHEDQVAPEPPPIAVPSQSEPIPPRPERGPGPSQPSTMSDTGSFHLPPPQVLATHAPPLPTKPQYAEPQRAEPLHTEPRHAEPQHNAPGYSQHQPNHHATPTAGTPLHASPLHEPTHVPSPQPQPPLDPSQVSTPAVHQPAYASTGSYTAQPSQVPRRSRANTRRRPGPPAKVVIPVLLLAMACFAVGFWALGQL
ncbi:serine/threonine-protein kinase [Streptomyces neyagawaensis]|uniref:serine/threonine-protein kinase n=1 Tax=Streptomyces neyagawaensis TaxID=42238 RepID=UPI00201D2855|nr:serine/threonine-protein kinase [Streptomyces neyagawaensis]MCL6739330.1 protein kinase [Streptomyces neyagawaensis]MDE1682068.1 protein kinase [Streptomyces neyagawaensis]